MYLGNGTLLCTFNGRGTFSLLFQKEKPSGEKKSYYPTKLAFHFEVLVMFEDFIILKGVCAHTWMLTQSLQRQHR